MGVRMAEVFEAGWEGRLGAILDRQRALLGQIDALSERQSLLIGASDTDRLLGLLAERARLAKELGDLGHQFARYSEQWDDVVASVDAAQARAWRGVLDGLRRTAERIAERDLEDSAAIRAAQENLTRRLAGVGQGRAAAAAYGGAGPRGGPRYQDRKG